MSLWLPDSRWEAPELLRPGQQPRGEVTLDYSNSLVRNLTFASIGNQGANLVGGPTWYYFTSGGFDNGVTDPVFINRYGKGFANASDQQFGVTTNNVPFVGSGPWSMVVVGTYLTGGWDANLVLINIAAGGTGGRTFFGASSSPGLRTNWDGNNRDSSLTPPAAGEIFVAGMRVNEVGLCRHFLNGNFANPAPTGPITGATHSDSPMQLGGAAFQPARSQFLATYCWNNRSLTDSEFQRLAADPYQLLIPK